LHKIIVRPRPNLKDKLATEYTEDTEKGQTDFELSAK